MTKVHVKVTEIDAPAGGFFSNSYQMWVSALPDSFGSQNNCVGKPLHCENPWTFVVQDRTRVTLEFTLKLWHLMKNSEPFAICKYSLNQIQPGTMVSEWLIMAPFGEEPKKNIRIRVDIHSNENNIEPFSMNAISIPVPMNPGQYPPQPNTIPSCPTGFVVYPSMPIGYPSPFPQYPIDSDQMIVNPYSEEKKE